MIIYHTQQAVMSFALKEDNTMAASIHVIYYVCFSLNIYLIIFTLYAVYINECYAQMILRLCVCVCYCMNMLYSPTGYL